MIFIITETKLKFRFIFKFYWGSCKETFKQENEYSTETYVSGNLKNLIDDCGLLNCYETRLFY